MNHNNIPIEQAKPAPMFFVVAVGGTLEELASPRAVPATGDLLEVLGRQLAIRVEDTTPSPWADGSTVESDS